MTAFAKDFLYAWQISSTNAARIGIGNKKSLTTEAGVEKGHGWTNFLRRHGSILTLFVIIVILLVIGSVYVFWWFAGQAQATRLVPSVLRFWTMAHVIVFILSLILWELVFIGIPSVIGAVAGWQWWRRLPEEEKRGYHFFGRRSRTTGGGGGASLLFFIAFAIKVYVDGNWNIAISTWTLDYVVGSIVTILIWMAAIFGIPIAIGILWWLSQNVKKAQPSTLGPPS